MVRVTALHEAGRKGLTDLECPVFEDKPFVTAKAIDKSRVALVSTAGLIPRATAPFRGGDSGYREIPRSVDSSDILISHISVNFDRSAAVLNSESVLPRQLLDEMVADGEVGSAAETHYSFMGATDPLKMEEHAVEVARALVAAGVDTAVFLPV